MTRLKQLALSPASQRAFLVVGTMTPIGWPARRKVGTRDQPDEA
ncbi:hypothetical protein ACSFBF_22795 [Variovorax sp. ZT5P49]